MDLLPGNAEALHKAKDGRESATPQIRWRWGLLAAVAMALLSLYPQIDFLIMRWGDWKGSFVSQSYDEETYAAYVNGLVLGRPRRTLPLEISDPNRPSYESFYSIQVVPSYLVASFVGLSGFTVSEAFILLTPLMAYLSTLLLFYLVASVTRDERFAAVSALGVLVFGTLAAGHSVVLDWIGVGNWYGSFLFLRRHTHAISFPIFLLFVVLIWLAFSSRGRRAWAASLGAAVTFVVLTFSYFYLWTAALAWLACFTGVWLLAHPPEWRRIVRRLLPLVLIAAGPFALYAVLVSRRDPRLDQVQVLELTRAPDLHRVPFIIAMLVMLLLIWGRKRRLIQWREPVVLLTLSLALMPFAVFNQQIITGRSLQPDHYEMFSANYLSLLALSLTLFFLWRGWHNNTRRLLSRWLIAILSCVVIGWGLIEMNVITRRNRPRNIERDSFIPVANRLAQLAAQHAKGPNEREVVFSPDVLVLSDNIAALAPQAPLMSMSLPFGAGLSIQEWRERHFQYLYYCGADPEFLRRALTDNEMVSTMSAFGYDRYNSNLTSNFRPVTSEEIQKKVSEYAQYVERFDSQRASFPRISYVVVDSQARFDFTNIDRWYRRDFGQVIGPFTLYQVEPTTRESPD